MLTSVDVKLKVISIVHASLSGSLGDKGLFTSSNILQIADVVRQAVLLLFLPCFLTIVRRETSKMFRH